MSAPPDLPDPAHHDVDSMLSRKFGREVANYFSGSPLNRVAFLRSDHTFISQAFTHPSTAFLLLNDLAPLTKNPAKLEYVTHKEVNPLTGENPFAKTEEEIIKAYNSSITVPLVLFLGLDERVRDGFEYSGHKGQPYFAVDVTPKGTIQEKANKIVEEVKARGLTFLPGRGMTLTAPEAAIFAQARALCDWNARNPFCAGCGQPTMSVNAGMKRVCPPTDYASVEADGTPHKRSECPTRKGVTNLSFPRTDPTVIMAVVSHDGQRLLLGRQHRWPAYWYSTLAGFCEPAESIEEAVRREVWEESGVRLGRVVIHSTQPWPYPANLMIGAIGQALPDGETINLGHDPELEDAKWVTMQEVREALRRNTSALGEGPPEGYKDGELRLPPQTAIAHQLLKAVTGGYLAAEPKI
ncbi:NUDIX hydrolase domain-like protein [Xylogone sp. PMI_703]|nr:NUDIX hydrolase domain-like protein [Xylogone sp. PMI_703]